MNVLVFDIETIPDIENGRKLYDLAGLSDEETAQAMNSLRLEKTGSSFQPHYLQKIIAISAVLRSQDSFRVWSLGEESASEAEIITRFYKGIEHYTPTLVSWNGNGFDLPVLHYRTLLHGIPAPRYWENGQNEANFRWNNYLNRYHERHLDLMDVLSAYQSKAFAPLDALATMLGFPGKMGMSGDKVWDAYQAGELAQIRHYCETDVLNTYLVYLRFEKMRGNLNESRYENEIERVKTYLAQHTAEHLHAFLNHWSQK